MVTEELHVAEMKLESLAIVVNIPQLKITLFHQYSFATGDCTLQPALTIIYESCINYIIIEKYKGNYTFYIFHSTFFE